MHTNHTAATCLTRRLVFHISFFFSHSLSPPHVDIRMPTIVLLCLPPLRMIFLTVSLHICIKSLTKWVNASRASNQIITTTGSPLLQKDYADADADDFDLNFVPDLPQLGAQFRRTPSNGAEECATSTNTAASSLGTSIADVHVEPFTATPRPRVRNRMAPLPPTSGDMLMLVTDSPNGRQYRNPVSYLGGPLLEPRNRKSLDSMLSVD